MFYQTLYLFELVSWWSSKGLLIYSNFLLRQLEKRVIEHNNWKICGIWLLSSSLQSKRANISKPTCLYLSLIKCNLYFVSSPFFISTGGLCLSTGSFILPNEPVGTSLRFSQLHISIMNPSGSLKKSWSIFVRFSTSSIVIFLYFMLRSFNFFSISSMFSH